MRHIFEPTAESDSASLIFRRAPWIGYLDVGKRVAEVVSRILSRSRQAGGRGLSPAACHSYTSVLQPL